MGSDFVGRVPSLKSIECSAYMEWERSIIANLLERRNGGETRRLDLERTLLIC
jgi:hypothetical protein